jgi:hypothetical protein
MRTRLRYRHHIVAHVLEDVTEVLAIPIHKDAAVVTHVLRVPAAKIGVKEGVRDAPQRLH